MNRRELEQAGAHTVPTAAHKPTAFLRLLVATREGQDRRGDVFSCDSGELVYPHGCLRDRCPTCDRRFAGCVTGGLTTTARLDEVDVSFADLLRVAAQYTEKLHWHDADLEGLAEDLLSAGEQGFDVGVVLRRDNDRLYTFTPRAKRLR